MRGRARHDDPARVEERPEALEQFGVRDAARGRGRGVGRAARRARRARRPRSAGRRRTISGFRSTLTTSGRSAARRPSPTSTLGERARVDGRLAAERLREQVARAQARRASRAPRARASGAAAKTTSPSASVRMPPSPSSTQGPNCGSRTRPAISSRWPRTMLGDQQRDRAVLGPRRASSSARRDAHRVRVGEPESHEIALGLVRDRVAAELQHHREAELARPRAPPPRRPARRAPRAIGTP